ncbi:MAG TPA: hypothetical protein PLK35_01885 [Candidatus Moranbacteria bacterium]|nr:hypothetical protein [Candidatus Moranbacteria bacterium]
MSIEPCQIPKISRQDGLLNYQEGKGIEGIIQNISSLIQGLPDDPSDEKLLTVGRMLFYLTESERGKIAGASAKHRHIVGKAPDIFDAYLKKVLCAAISIDCLAFKKDMDFIKRSPSLISSVVVEIINQCS